ncbi:MAG: glycosyltransferase [Melioribacteraceae bacterium]
MISSNYKNSTLSVIIATKDRFEYLRNCVDSILGQSVLPDEVVIVDGSVMEDFENKIRELFWNAHTTILTYTKSRATLTVDYNLGASKSRGELLTFVDDDTVLDEHYIEHVKDFFAKHTEENIGALSCKILDPAFRFTSQKQHFSVTNAISRIFFLQSMGDGKFKLSGLPTLIDPNTSELKMIEFIHGGSATHRRKVFEEFKFDESLPGGFNLNDDDLAYRISRKYQNYWTPKAFLFHKSHYVKNDRYMKSKSFIICHFYLKRKNYPKDFRHRFGFYWSLLGRVILELAISIKNQNISGLKGTFSGLINVCSNNIDPRNVI